jgi:hypothetical protein
LNSILFVFKGTGMPRKEKPSNIIYCPLSQAVRIIFVMPVIFSFKFSTTITIPEDSLIFEFLGGIPVMWYEALVSKIYSLWLGQL